MTGRLVAVTVWVAIAASGPAFGDVAILTAPTRNMNCSGGVCSPTAADAVLNVSDLATLLASGNVTVTTTGSGGIQSDDIFLDSPLSWSSNAALKLDAYRSLTIDKPVSVLGSGGLAFVTNDGGANGTLVLDSKGRVSFANLSSDLSINGATYALVGTVQSLSSAIAANPGGNYALASDYDAKADGTYTSAPISTYFTGAVEGLGNTISNLTVNDPTSRTKVGLFAEIQGVISDLTLAKVHIRGHRHMEAGALAGESIGNLINDSVSGSISSVDGDIGGLVGENGGFITRSSSSASVSSRGRKGSVGGLVGDNGYDGIDSSFATGSVTAGDLARAGGLVGSLGPGTVTNSYATGAVLAGMAAQVGGLTGEFYDATVATSYSTGNVQGGAHSNVGGFAGSEIESSFSDCYWDITTSGTNQGVGTGGSSGVTGLSTAQFQSGLPTGFDRSIWKEKSKIQNGFPYLLANRPPN